MHNDANENITNNYRIDNSRTVTSESFEYKTTMIGNTPADKTLDTEVAAPLKYLSNLCRSLDLSLINCEMELDLSWPKDFIISEISRTAAVAANRSNPARPATLTIIGIFHIHSTKLYVLVVTLSTNDNIKFPEKMKQGFKRTVL